MRRHAVKLVLATLVVGVVTGLLSASLAKGATTPPPRPSFVQPDGEVNLANLPVFVPVYGNGGQVVGWVKTADLVEAPSNASAPATLPTDGLVNPPKVPIYDAPNAQANTIGTLPAA
jgi:hypothetical protein